MAVAIALQQDGKIVAGGICVGPLGDNDFLSCATQRRQQCGTTMSHGYRWRRQFSPTDALILARVALGMTGDAVLAGINVSNAPRNTWAAIRVLGHSMRDANQRMGRIGPKWLLATKFSRSAARHPSAPSPFPLAISEVLPALQRKSGFRASSGSNVPLEIPARNPGRARTWARNLAAAESAPSIKLRPSPSLPNPIYIGLKAQLRP